MMPTTCNPTQSVAPADFLTCLQGTTTGGSWAWATRTTCASSPSFPG
jgi:hypothetical protein